MKSSFGYPNILIVDHNPATRIVIARTLRAAGLKNFEAAAHDQAMMLSERDSIELVLMSPFVAHEVTVRQTVRWFHRRTPRVPVVLTLTWDITDHWQRQLEADDWIRIPPVLDELLSTIHRLTS